MKLKNKVIIVTGGGRGIGRSASIMLAANGAKVAVVAKTDSEINSVAQEISSAGNIAIPIVMRINNGDPKMEKLRLLFAIRLK